MTDKHDVIYPAGKNVAFVEGQVVPIGPKQLSPQDILVQLRDVVSQPYTGLDADKIGMTLLEAALYAAAKKAAEGDTDALTKLLDRLMGKPVQQVLSASGSLKEFLDAIAKSEPAANRDIDPLGD